MSQNYEVAVRLNADGSGLVTQSKASAEALDRVSASADKVTKSFGQTFAASTQHVQATQAEAKEVAKLDAELGALLGRLDPVYGASIKLAQAENLLAQGLRENMLSRQRYNEALTQARAAYSGAANDADHMAESTDKGAFATAGARRELIVLGHEALQGNFSRMPGSFMVLAERANFSGAAILGVVAPIALVAGAAVGMAAAFAQGHKEMEATNNALAVTGNFAGLTRGSMNDMAASVSRAGTLTIGTSKEMVTAIVASGRYGADNVALLAGLIDKTAHATGQSVEKITPELVKMFENPAKASEALNQQYHHLNVAELERIRTLENTGRSQEATTAALRAASGAMPDYTRNIGYIEAAWLKAKQAASDYWDKAKGAGRDATPQDEVAAARANLTAAQNLNASPQVLAQLNAALDLAQRQVAVNEKLAQIRANALQTQERELAAQKEVEKSQTYQITQLEQMRAKVADAPDSPDKARRLFEINKQIRDLQISMGAEGATMANQRIASALQLREISLAMAGEQNDTALKLKQVNQADHDATKTWLELQKNAMQQIAVQQQIAVGNMTAGQRQALELTLKRLEAEAQAIQQRGNDQQAVDAYNAAKAQEAIVNDMIDGVNKLGGAEQKRLTAAIAAQRLHNDEIGKTKDQIDRVKQAEQDAATAKLQAEADAIAALLNQQDLDQNVVAIYTAQLVQLNAQIAARKELSGLMADASTRQQQADFARAQSEEYKRLFNTVEQTGKTVFTHLLSDGKGAFESIGKALKASVIDLLYQMTVRPWIIQIGASFAQQLGISTTTGMLAGAGGVGNGLSLASGANSAYNLFTGSGPIAAGYGAATGGAYGGAFGATSVGEFAPLAAGVEAGGGVAAGASAALSAVPGWGWAALAAMAVLSMSGDGGGPKASDASLRRRANGDFGIEMNNVAGGDPDIAQVLAMNAALNDPTRFDPAKLAGLVDTQVGTGSPADTATLISQLTAALKPAADSAASMTAATQALTAAEQAAAQATAQKQAAVAAERQGLQDQLDQLTMTSAQLMEKQRNALDESNRALFDQVQAATAAAEATKAETEAKAAAAQQAAETAARVANERQGLQDQLDQLTMTSAQLLDKQRNALDESNRALFDQVRAANASTAAAQAEAAAKNEAAAAATALATTQSSLTSSQQALQSAVNALPSKLGIDALQKAQQGLAVSEYNAPLDRVAAARSLLDQTYASGIGGDLAAVQAFPQQLQSALSIARDAFASGPDFQEIFLDGNRKLNDLLQRQNEVQIDLLKDVPLTIQQASNDQIAVMRTELRALGEKFDKMTAELRRVVA